MAERKALVIVGGQVSQLPAGDSIPGTGSLANRTIVGTTNQIAVANGDGVAGNPTLSTPQNLHTGASVQFASVTADTFNGLGIAEFLGYEVCQFRLTISSGTHISPTDTTSATLYWTPYKGNLVGLYDGTQWRIRETAELSLSMTGLNGNHDIFAYDNAGTPALEALAWTNDTTRATGLTRQDGILVKSGALTRRYLGTVRVESGIVPDRTFKRFVWNYYNRLPHRLWQPILVTGDTWTYNSSTWRAANDDSNNKVEVVIGWQEDALWLMCAVLIVSTGTSFGIPGIAKDGTTANDADVGGRVGGASGPQLPANAFLHDTPTAGYHFYTQVERTEVGSVTFGESADGRFPSGLTGRMMA